MNKLRNEDDELIDENSDNNHSNLPVWAWALIFLPLAAAVVLIFYAKLKIGIFGFKL